MKADQTIIPLPVAELPARVLMLRHEGWRLVHISATPAGEQIEVNYGFDRLGVYQTLRVTLPAAAPRLPSISRIYWAAFVYENEMHDLFDVQVEGMAVDFHGHFIKTATPFPFRNPDASASSSASPRSGAVPGASFTAIPAAPPSSAAQS
ncbi:NADH-quinone oxidoreductase subunit C [Fontisphaera persica]|uniref:NADH-quinone oxidoreductase subunit C n=1 Tax=Fontisphaera persica TaxID=2974023 RepID=UPI0024C05A1F|nr:NADH-quinone oxidoreductase subunit C [Fontisphaera persica]WCJ60240.1 NADH-quinone oxidoreductase subunit C [Fontisphaera persica]